MERSDLEKMFTPIEPRFLTETQKAVLVKLQRQFLDVATDILADIPESAQRTKAFWKLLEVKTLCSHAVTHVGYEKVITKEIKTNANKEKVSEKKTENHAS